MRLWGKKVKGLIGFYELSDWWLSTFTKRERQDLEQSGNQTGTASLTKGKAFSSQHVTDFLSVLAMGKEKSIAKRIQQKISEVAEKTPLREPGCYRGRHFTTYVEEVKQLKRDDRLQEAEALLVELVKATEAEGKKDRLGVAPWYYEQLAIVYRKRKDYASEVRILERYAKQKHARGATPAALAKRLQRARVLLETEKKKLKR